MKIFDKASWQIDNGMNEEVVIAHFKFIFEWLKEHNMLSPSGLEILDIGIDEDVSLHEGLVNERGLHFLDEYYDKLIADSQYDVAREKVLIDILFGE